MPSIPSTVQCTPHALKPATDMPDGRDSQDKKAHGLKGAMHGAGSQRGQGGQSSQYGSSQATQYAGYPNISPAPDSYQGGQRQQQQGGGTQFPPAPAYAGMPRLAELPVDAALCCYCRCSSTPAHDHALTI